MKIMISIQENSPESVLDEHFGRAAYFMIIDLKTHDSEILENPAKTLASGAGAAVVQLAVDRQVQTVFSGRFGPHAAQALTASGIKMQQFPQGCKTVQELLNTDPEAHA